MDKQIEPVLENKDEARLASVLIRIIEGARVEEHVGDWKMANSGEEGEKEVRLWSTDGQSSLSFSLDTTNDQIVLECTSHNLDKEKLADSLNMINGMMEALSKDKRKEVVASFAEVPDGEMKSWLTTHSYEAKDGTLRRHIRPNELKAEA